MSSTPSRLDQCPHRVMFMLLPEFSMGAFASAIEPLRIANMVSDQEIYTWTLASADGAPVTASNGIEFKVDGSFVDLKSGQTVCVCSGQNVHKYQFKPLHNWLRKQSRLGVNLSGVCTGSYILAAAGLLDGYRCTIHWENLAAFAEDFPDITASTRLFEIDRDRFTCAGGTSPIDMMVTLIALSEGKELAQSVAEEMIHAPVRDQTENQRISLPARIGVRHPKLVNVVEIMESNLEEPLSPSRLAKQVGISTRQLERLFSRYLSRSPKRYYLELRLQKARQLLLQTSMSVINVALACGFTSPSHFSKCYRTFFERTPYRERGLPGPHLSAAVALAEDRAAEDTAPEKS